MFLNTSKHKLQQFRFIYLLVSGFVYSLQQSVVDIRLQNLDTTIVLVKNYIISEKNYINASFK